MAGKKKAAVKKAAPKKAEGARKGMAKAAGKEAGSVAKAAKKETAVAKEEMKVEAKKEERKGGTIKVTADLLKAGETLLYPLITEKAVNLIDSENKLVFVVAKGTTREGVKKAVEQLYKVKVDKVNILKDTRARKRAFVKLNKEFKAEEIATKLGVL